MSSITIKDLRSPSNTQQSYEVIFFDDKIKTMVTHSATEIDNWISENLQIHQSRLKRLIIGLDIEWRPNFRRGSDNPAALLQLCIGRMCLIIQLFYAEIPQSLVDFLNNPDFTFVGVGIKQDVQKLLRDCNLRVAKTVDISRLVKTNGGEKKPAGLKGLAREVLGKEIEKPKKISTSRWDAEWLTYAQIQYACVDAFLSFEIAKLLMAKE